MASGRNWIFFLRKITKRLYRYRGWSRVADLVRKAYIHDPRRFRIDDLDGDLMFDCALNEHISSQVFWRGDYSTDQLALLRRILKPGMVFLDAGANKGEFSVIAAKYTRGGKVLAFEPMDATAKELEANIAANGFRHVRVIEKALGKAAAERFVYHSENEHSENGSKKGRPKEELNLGTFTLFPRTGLERPCGRIGVVSLDEFLRSGPPSRIDVMKIDIEGGELEMLQGAVETIGLWKPVILIEVNAITSRAAGYDQADILRWLEGMGYRCERIGRKGKTHPVTIAGLKAFQNLVCWPGDDPENAKQREEGGSSGAEQRPIGKIAFFIPDMRGGGAEKAVVNLLGELAKRRLGPGPVVELELVLVHAAGVYLKELPPAVSIVDLGKKRTLSALPGLVRYLRKNRPSALIAHLSHANTIALLAKKIARVETRVIVVEHRVMGSPSSFFSKQRFLEWGMKKMYPGATERVAVSMAAAAALASRLGLPQASFKTIYNPVVDDALLEKAKLSPGHPWLEKKEGLVFLAVGRLDPEKDFSTLLEAFARVKAAWLAAGKGAVRLILLGEGRLRGALEAQARLLGIEAEVSMPGFAKNPFAYMARCDVFVLSSRLEGLSNSLIEAMACGCPVISTDCPAGPREVLEDGRFGRLTPVGDVAALAGAMMETLQATSGKRQEEREERIRRASFFSAEKAADAWSSLLNERPRRVVLHLITGLRTGGAERMLCQLLVTLDRRHWEPVVVSLTDGSGPEAWLREQGIPVHCLGMRAGRWPAPAMAVRLMRLARKIRPDLIHGWMYHGNLAAQFAHLFLPRRIPVIWGIHHSIASLAAEKKTTVSMIRLGARLSGLPLKIVYASQVSSEQHIALGYRAEKTILIPNGVDPGIYLPAMGTGASMEATGARASVRKEWGLSSADLLIGSLARYHPVKDHENFLRAAALLSQRYADGPATGIPATGLAAMGLTRSPRFLLAGQQVDPHNEILQSLIRELGLADRVHLLGERKDPERFLAALDIFTISSFSEALPMALLEAMSCGLPCVTTDIGDAARVVGDTGKVVPIRDPEALASAWEELIAAGEEKRRSLGAAARARIMTNYTLSASASAYDALYRESVE